MSSTNITMTTPKSSMYYDRTYPITYPITCFDNTVEADTENILKKQYNYSKATVSHGEKIEETVCPDTVEHTKYSGVIISHGEKIKEVPEYIPKKKYMWTTVVDFFKQRQKFGRHPFLYTPNI